MAKQLGFSKARADIIEMLRTEVPWQKSTTKFSRRVRVHEVADEKQIVVRSVDMNEDIA